ncbi:MAG: 50S ribosomal protein L4 [Planctomycetes bacterium]|nr:50S ribosomal protein L4 [Planctomycetota bacterium]
MSTKPDNYTIPVFTAEGAPAEPLTVPAGIFGGLVRVKALHQVVVMYEANRRVGTHSVKTRSEVARRRKKMYRQKGTGRARAGHRTSPLRVGGGIAHGPHPRDYSFTVPKKVRRAALAAALFSKVRDGEMRIVEKLEFAAPKTSTAAALLKKIDVAHAALVAFAATGAVAVAPAGDGASVAQPSAPVAVAGGKKKHELPKPERLAVEARALSTARAARRARVGQSRLSEGDRRVVKSIRNIGGVEVAEVADLNAYDVLRHRFLVVTRPAFERLRQGYSKV